jgi:hypothetical protein
MNKKTALTMMSMLALSGLLVIAACNKKENTEQSNNNMAQQQAAPAPAAAPIDPATVGSVKGTVKFDGTAPKAAKIDMSQDPACKGANEAESVIVSGGDLANVVCERGPRQSHVRRSQRSGYVGSAGLQVSSTRVGRHGRADGSN